MKIEKFEKYDSDGQKLQKILRTLFDSGKWGCTVSKTSDVRKYMSQTYYFGYKLASSVRESVPNDKKINRSQ